MVVTLEQKEEDTLQNGNPLNYAGIPCVRVFPLELTCVIPFPKPSEAERRPFWRDWGRLRTRVARVASFCLGSQQGMSWNDPSTTSPSSFKGTPRFIPPPPKKQSGCGAFGSAAVAGFSGLHSSAAAFIEANAWKGWPEVMCFVESESQFSETAANQTLLDRGPPIRGSNV